MDNRYRLHAQNKGKGRFCNFYSFSILLCDPGLKYRFCRHLNKIGPLGIELASGLCNDNDSINTDGR